MKLEMHLLISFCEGTGSSYRKQLKSLNEDNTKGLLKITFYNLSTSLLFTVEYSRNYENAGITHEKDPPWCKSQSQQSLRT